MSQNPELNGENGKKALEELHNMTGGEKEVKTEGLGTIKIQAEEKKPLEIGYRNIPKNIFPSESFYYPPDFELSIRSLDVEEIKHYSSMDESDVFDVELHINDILEKACRIRINGGLGSYRDLKEADKLFTVFMIRDITMEKHQRDTKLTLMSACNKCPKDPEKIEINSDIFSYYKIGESLKKYFRSDIRAFVMGKNVIGEDINFYIPSIGVATAISDYMMFKKNEERSGRPGYFNSQFLTALQFLVEDWRMVNTAFIDKMQRKYDSEWSVDKIQMIQAVIERITLKIKPSLTRKCSKCGGEVTTPIRFSEGYRSIFYLSDFAGKLFGDEEQTDNP